MPTHLEPSSCNLCSFMKDRAEFLKEDLKHLFDDQGIDQSQYNDKVEFRDPITSYNSVKGTLLCLQSWPYTCRCSPSFHPPLHLSVHKP